MQWKPIVNFEGTYAVSDEGNVKRIGKSRGATLGKFVTPNKHTNGYLAVRLWENNLAKSKLIHRLVAEAFLVESIQGLEINHKDGDKTNNCVCNLEIVTRQENIDHAISIDLTNNNGSKNPMAKLTESDVQEIVILYATGVWGYKKLGKKYQVTWGAIRNIIKGRSWTNLNPN